MGRRGDDGDLARSAQRGESWALTEVWHRYSPSVMAYLRGRGVADPEDMTSEVFLQVFRRINRFRGDEGDLRTFVFSVAHARYVDDRRRLARHGVDVGYLAERDDRAAPSAETEAMTALGTERVRALIEALSP